MLHCVSDILNPIETRKHNLMNLDIGPKDARILLNNPNALKLLLEVVAAGGCVSLTAEDLGMDSRAAAKAAETLANVLRVRTAQYGKEYALKAQKVTIEYDEDTLPCSHCPIWNSEKALTKSERRRFKKSKARQEELYGREFDQFFWPRIDNQVNRGKCRSAYIDTRIAKKTDLSAVELADLYNLYHYNCDSSDQWVKHPCNWLLAECWEDDEPDDESDDY